MFPGSGSKYKRYKTHGPNLCTENQKHGHPSHQFRYPLKIQFYVKNYSAWSYADIKYHDITNQILDFLGRALWV